VQSGAERFLKLVGGINSAALNQFYVTAGKPMANLAGNC